MTRETAAQGEGEPLHEPEQEAEHPVDGRLRVYLRRLVAAHGGRMKAADALGVNYKTLARGLDEAGPLTMHLRAALLVKALEDGVAALAAAGDKDEATDAGAAASTGRIGELADEVRGSTEALRDLMQAVEELRGEHGERLAALEERLAPVIGASRVVSRDPSTSPGGQPAAPPVVPGELAPRREDAPGAKRRDGSGGPDEERERGAGDSAERPPAPTVRGGAVPAAGRTPVTKPRRAHPDLVTLEPEEGEELVYGEKVTPLIAEWREARAAFIDRANSRVERATAWVRMCERAITLIGEHELTLPLADYPWDRFERRRELERSEESLRDARRELRRARCWRFLRRALTFGRWRR